MSLLETMPVVEFDAEMLKKFGVAWHQGSIVKRKKGDVLLPHRLAKGGEYSSNNLGKEANKAVANALLKMFGEGFEIEVPGADALIPSHAYCIELDSVRVIGGVRPQNYDVVYRPDGVRFAFDSKTLNDTESIRKNYQNMINDLGTEATTAHTRFPYAVVAFMFLLPAPCWEELSSAVRRGIIGSLERLFGRPDVNGAVHKAEALALVAWNPDTGIVDPKFPADGSPLSLETFSQMITETYTSRYQGLEPHTEKKRKSKIAKEKKQSRKRKASSGQTSFEIDTEVENEADEEMELDDIFEEED